MTQRDRFRGAAVALIGSETAGSMAFLRQCLGVSGLPDQALPAERCADLALWYRKNNLLRQGNPSPGDVALLGDGLGGEAERAGIVDYLGNGKVYTVECSSGRVKRSDHLLSDSAVIGYAAPLFTDDEPAEPTESLVKIKLQDSGKVVELPGQIKGGVPLIPLPAVEKLAPVTVGWDETERLHTVAINYK